MNDLGSRPNDTGSRAEAAEAVRALVRTARVLERASTELSMAHYRVLAAIAAGDDRASRVAERLELGRPTVSAAVDALCRGGLLRRDEVADDQRASDLQLTPAGAALLERVEDEMIRRLDGLLSRVPDGARVQAGIVSLGAALDEMHAERLRRHRRVSR